MNTVLWIAQILLALAFLMAGFIDLRRGKTMRFSAWMKAHVTLLFAVGHGMIPSQYDWMEDDTSLSWDGRKIVQRGSLTTEGCWLGREVRPGKHSTYSREKPDMRSP